MPTRNKPLKKERDKKDVENLKLENKRREEAKKRAAKQQEYRKKPRISSQAELQKERTKISKKRHAARINYSISVTQKTSDYGDYLWIDSIPICDMTQLLTNFKTTEFQKIYKNNCSAVKACNPSLTSAARKKEQSTYWILNEKKGIQLNGSGHWKDHPNTSETHDIVLSNFMMKIGRGRLKQKTTFLTLFSICIPGILASDIESGSTKSRETSAKATFQPSKLPFIL